MFTYLHCYLPETWDAQVKAGFIRPQDGIRFVESIELDEDKKFNNLARKNGELYNIIKERKCPFYIDRLQGGCNIEDYPYDMDLINDYRRMLGDKFWGYQMHEWMSNILSDIGKLKRNKCPAWTAEEIEKTIRKAYPFTYLFLECMNAKEFEEAGCPETAEEFLKLAENLFIKRQKRTDGMLLTCDSACLAYQLELKHGTKRIMPELGAQTADTRIQVAYARGMAKAYGIPFGAYYEPWGGDPFSACCFQRDDKNEWNMKNDDTPYQSAGGFGGSSRSLQRRTHLYAYMAGVEFMAEEWGMSNTFYDWKDFEVTPYGEVKLEFLKFTDRYPDIGKLITPVAVVLPKELPVLEGLDRAESVFVGYEIKGEFADKVVYMRNVLRNLFSRKYPTQGSFMETRSLVNCVTPDAMDIVNEDALKADEYKYIVDLTGNKDFAKKYKDKIISPDEVTERINEELPCLITGEVLRLVNKADGTNYVMLLNNSGVFRKVKYGDKLIKSEQKTVIIETKNKEPLFLLEGDASMRKLSDGKYEITVPAGGWFFGKF